MGTVSKYFVDSYGCTSWTMTVGYPDDPLTVSGAQIPVSSLISSASCYRSGWLVPGTWSSNLRGTAVLYTGLSGASYGTGSSSDPAGYVSWGNGVTVRLNYLPYSVSTSSLFNSSNRNSRSVVASTSMTANADVQDLTYALSYYGSGDFGTINLRTVVLDAPPDLSTVEISSSDADGIYWTPDTVGTNNCTIVVKNVKIQYSGYGKRNVLKIGDAEFVYENGTNSTYMLRFPFTDEYDIAPGTYTPTLTVTDTRDQVSSVELSPITITQYIPSTYDITQVQSDTDGFFVNRSTASITISNIVCPEDVHLAKARLTIGSKNTLVTLDGTEQTITVSLPLTEIGTFTPEVRVYDSRNNGSINEITRLNPITVSEYIAPTVTADIQRVNSSAVYDDEGTNMLIAATFAFNSMVHMSEPVVAVGNDSCSIVWYETIGANGLEDEIDWSIYDPNSPVTIYGFSDGYGTTSGYDISSSFPITITPVDSVDSGTPIIGTLAQAFYTIHFKAGGHAIAFGKKAVTDGTFDCYLNAIFDNEVQIELDQLDVDDKALYDVLVELGGGILDGDLMSLKKAILRALTWG